MLSLGSDDGLDLKLWKSLERRWGWNGPAAQWLRTPSGVFVSELPQNNEPHAEISRNAKIQGKVLNFAILMHTKCHCCPLVPNSGAVSFSPTLLNIARILKARKTKNKAISKSSLISEDQIDKYIWLSWLHQLCGFPLPFLDTESLNTLPENGCRSLLL